VIEQILPQQDGALGGRKTMDKFMESKWFMRIVGLSLALLLYASVNFDDLNEHKSASDNPQNIVEIIEDVPVEAFYDTENLFVSGLPSTVDVEIKGTKAIVQQTKTLKDFNVYVDLNDLGIGKHQVPIEIENISDKLTVTVEPDFANITIQEKVTEEFAVEAEFDESLLANGFEVDGLSVEPKTVKVTGAKDAIESITYVKATLDVQDAIHETTTREARVQVLDRELNKLDVTVEPEAVDVTVTVVNPSKEVPVVVKEKGKLPQGVKLESIAVEQKEATVYGKASVLDTLEELVAEVDLSEITKDTVVNVPLKLKDGLNRVAPEEVKVTIDVSTTKEKTISGVPLNLSGPKEEYDYTIVSPENEEVDIVASGYSEELDALSAGDFVLDVNLAELEPGEHEVEIKPTGPESVKWELSTKTVTVQIKEKTTAEAEEGANENG
jgi:YbbR domain-containing protein